MLFPHKDRSSRQDYVWPVKKFYSNDENRQVSLEFIFFFSVQTGRNNAETYGNF